MHALLDVQHEFEPSQPNKTRFGGSQIFTACVRHLEQTHLSTLYRQSLAGRRRGCSRVT